MDEPSPKSKSARNTSNAERPRLASDVMRRLPAAVDNDRSAQINEMLRLFLDFDLVVPPIMGAPSSVGSLAPLIEGAQKRLLLVDGTMLAIATTYATQLRAAAERGVALTFVLIDPTLPADSPLYSMLELQSSGPTLEVRRNEVRRLIDESQQAVGLLRQLKAELEESGKNDSIAIRGCCVLPQIGIVVPDPPTVSPPAMVSFLQDKNYTMRVTILSNGKYSDEFSYLTIRTNTDTAALTYAVLLQQLERLLDEIRSRDLG